MMRNLVINSGRRRDTLMYKFFGRQKNKGNNNLKQEDILEEENSIRDFYLHKHRKFFY